MDDIKSLTLEELIKLCDSAGWERYRAYQIFQWIWQKDINSFEQMTNLSKKLRTELAERFYISQLSIGSIVTAPDRTKKFLFILEDGKNIESVLISDRDRHTICVSTQVGCPLGCRFCATATIGFQRNLKWFEIAEQIRMVIKTTRIHPRNVVMMGMGEPLLNLDEVLKAVRVINSDYGFKIGARRITISTAGIPHGIYRIAEFPVQIRLAISLNATTDEIRSQLMPINRRYPIKKVLEAAQTYVKKTGRRVTVEYVLIDGVNNLPADADRLCLLLRDLPCKINLIPFNPFPNCGFKQPDSKSIQNFARTLYPYLPAVTIRKSRGSSILAGCGQLAGRL